jgi:hypothetical protein
VRLLGSRCRVCGETSFPERAYCPRCRSEDLEPARIHGPATLMSWTVVHQAPPAFTTPLAVGYAAFPSDVVVLGPIDAPRERLVTGLRLRVVEGRTSVSSDGTPLVSYRFAPDEPEASGLA